MHPSVWTEQTGSFTAHSLVIFGHGKFKTNEAEFHIAIAIPEASLSSRAIMLKLCLNCKGKRNTPSFLFSLGCLQSCLHSSLQWSETAVSFGFP